jgi:hypothetical protein
MGSTASATAQTASSKSLPGGPIFQPSQYQPSRGGYTTPQPIQQGMPHPPSSSELTSPQLPRSDELEALIPTKTRAEVLREFRVMGSKKESSYERRLLTSLQGYLLTSRVP